MGKIYSINSKIIVGDYQNSGKSYQDVSLMHPFLKEKEAIKTGNGFRLISMCGRRLTVQNAPLLDLIQKK